MLFRKNRREPTIIVESRYGKDKEQINRAIGIIEGVICGVNEAAAIGLSKAINLLNEVIGESYERK